MFNTVFQILFLTFTLNPVRPYAVYTIISAGKLELNSNYCVSIDVKDADDLIQFNVSIINTNLVENSVLVNETSEVGANTRRDIKLRTGNWSQDGEYILSIKCEGGLEVEHESKLTLDVPGVMIFAETDKTVYKSNEIVRFRVIIIDSNLKPISNAEVEVKIKDADRNVVKLYKENASINGIFSGELQLTDQPMLGEWTIAIQALEQYYPKYFTVAEYVLPAFGVTIKVPPFVTSKSVSFIATVDAKYTYGKSVKGNMTFTISELDWGEKKKFIFKSDIDGEISIPIEISDLIDGYFYGMKKFILRAAVTDSLSERTTGANTTVDVYSDQYEFKLLQNRKSFKVGIDYKIIIRVSYRDGKPVENNGPPLKVNYGYDSVNTLQWHEVSVVPFDGIVVLILNTTVPHAMPSTPTPYLKRRVEKKKKSKSVVIQKGKVRHTRTIREYYRQRRILIDVSYKDEKTRIGTLTQTKESENCFIQIDVEDYPLKHFKVNDSLHVSVFSVSPLHDLNYKIISRRGIIGSKHFKSSKRKRRNFTINLTSDMTPRIRLFVYQICLDSISTDYIEIDVDGVFQNFVSIAANVTSATPNSNVSIKLDTNANSTVSLMAIDQKILLLKSGNSIDKQTIVNEIVSHVGCKKMSNFGSCTEEVTSNSNVKHEFKNSGLILFSSHICEASTYTNEYDYVYHGNYHGSRPMSSSLKSMSSRKSYITSSESVYSSTTETPTFSTKSVNTDNVQIRQNFPETWIWTIFDLNETLSYNYVTSVPDTITSWIITAFAINKNDGLAVIENPISINVFRSFFVSLILPYSIIRGETVALKVTIYNYMKTAQQTEVTLMNANNEFIINNKSESRNQIKKIIIIPPNDGVTVSFMVTPIKVGHLTVDVIAYSDSVGDRVIEKLLVKPEGETIYENKAMFICLNNATKQFTKKVQILYPYNITIVKNSKKVSLSAYVDILGSVINNLDDLLLMPYGCGEQNMINFVPNIIVLNYLTKANKLTDMVKRKAINHMQTGYQKELTYKHSDGSYSAFGQSDYVGSTWLTAFVIKSFKQAKNYISIDKDVIKEGVDFLFQKQIENGCFIESGKVLNKAMQSGSSSTNATLTAYVLIAISMDDDLTSEQLSKCEHAEKFLIASLENSSDLYEIAIISYALHLRDSTSKEIAFKKLMALANHTKDYTFWSNSSCLDIEINAYSLMTLILRNENDTSLSVLRWLISKQNSRGGFETTQDTVVALQALALFAEKFTSNFSDVVINIETNKHERKLIEVKSTTGVTLHLMDLNKSSKYVNINATGVGCTYVQVSWQYNVKKLLNNAAFEIKLNSSESESQSNKTDDILKFAVCVRTITINESGMAVMEISLPSGFVGDQQAINSFKNQLIKRVEMKQSNTLIVFYFDQITQEVTCTSVVANRDSNVFNLQMVPIVVYDYYDKSQKTTIFYSPNDLNI